MSDFYATTGTAQGTGDGSSEANRIELKKAIENDAGLHAALAAGDTIYCKDDGELVFDGSAGAFSTTAVAGTSDAPIRVIGYTTSITDGGLIEIRDSDAGATNSCFSITQHYWHWENIRVTDPRDAWESNHNGLYWRNCHSVNAAGSGFDGPDTTGDSPTFAQCSSIGSTNDGFEVLHRGARFIDCVSIGNSSNGFQAGSAAYGATFVRCLSHNNGGEGFSLAGECVLTDCLADGNTSDGYFCDGGNGFTLLVNCGSTNNGVGVNGDAGAIVYAVNCGLNPTNHANTSGKSSNVTLHEVGAIAGDPLFTDRANDDFSPATSSAWLNAGASLGGAGWP